MSWELYQGDCIEVMRGMPEKFVQTCVTSPPYYGLRDYGVEGQIGLEESPDEYVQRLVEVFREVRRVLRDDGTVWLNLGDSYNGARMNRSGQHGYKDGRSNRDKRFSVGGVEGLKPKDLVGIPWMVAFALRADGWYLRSDCIWHKPNAMPETVTDRPTKAHEYIFLLTKNSKYYFNSDLIREPNQDKYDGKRGSTKTRTKFQSAMRTMSDKEEMKKYATQGRNKRTVWSVEEQIDFIETLSDELECYGIDKNIIEEALFNSCIMKFGTVWNIPTKPFKEAHFATYPPDLIEPCILAGCPEGGVVLDPFVGSGTTLLVATRHHRRSIGIELNPEYIEIAKRRLDSVQLKLVME